MEFLEHLPRTVHDLFTHSAGRFPDRTALVFGGERLTYGELNAGTNQLARHLRALGVGAETSVAICLDRSIELLASILGVLKAGGAYIPMDPRHPIDRLRHVLSDSQAPVLITTAGLQSLFADYAGQLVLLDEAADAIAGRPTDALTPIAGPENLAYVMYTSGSTGRPKGVMVEHRNVVNSLAGHQERYPAGPDAAYLFKTNHGFDASVLEIFGAWWEGGRLVILPPGDERDPAAVWRAIAHYGVTHLFFVPTPLQLLLDLSSPRDLDVLRGLQYVLIGGEALSRRLGMRLLALGGTVRFANIYGPTETTIFSSGYLLEGTIQSATTPVGTPFVNQTMYLLDERLQPVAPGALGEMYIGGASVARGYLHAPDLTRQRFIDDPFAPGGRLYKTGDLCRCLPTGQLEFVERVDRQIKIRGHRVELGDIESHLCSHPAIAQAVVTASDLQGDTRLTAYYVATDPAKPVDAGALRRHLQQQLPAHMIPAGWRQLPALPTNTAGKLDRKALPAVEIEAAPAGTNEPDASLTLPERIRAAWTAELGTSDFAADEDFFALGGHSLSAVRVAASLRTTLHKDLTPGDIYRAPTLAAFVTLVSQAPDLPQAGDSTSLPARRRTGAFPLSYPQLDLWLLARSHSPHLNVLDQKRVAGRLDRAALTTALSRVIADHPALRCRFGCWLPRQTVHGRTDVTIDERDLSHLSPAQREEASHASMQELARHTTWPQDRPMLIARLLRFDSNLSELQICMPHIVTDEASMKIFFDELSDHYLNIVNEEPIASPLVEEEDYETFVREEREVLRRSLKEDVAFWERYFAGTCPIFFPEHEVLATGPGNESVYVEWPAEEVAAIQMLARAHQLGLSDVLHALALSVAAPYVRGSAGGRKEVALFTPRSARTRASYDRSIGLFARLECLKADVADVSDLVALARRVRDAKAETARHQTAPIAVKSAGLQKARWEKLAFSDLMIRAMARVLTTVAGKAELNYEVLVSQLRIMNLQRSPQPDFALLVNVLNSFVSTEEGRTLFGSPLVDVEHLQTAHPPVRRVLEVYFLREPNRGNRHLLMLNGDLTPAFRRDFGAHIVTLARGCVHAA